MATTRRGRVSIHAPRVGSDLRLFRRLTPGEGFNPRSPRGERRRWCPRTARRGTVSIHAPRVGSDAAGVAFYVEASTGFNPRSPRGERLGDVALQAREMAFQSTLPAWGATRDVLQGIDGELVSIHAPRVGSDPPGRPRPQCWHRFNPRSPRGERPHTESMFAVLICFNPRSPRGERPSTLAVDSCPVIVSIHAPRVGSDHDRYRAALRARVSIHAPRVGSDDGKRLPMADKTKFQSTLPAWGATSLVSTNSPSGNCFNPRSPRGERPPGRSRCTRWWSGFNPRSPRGERRVAGKGFPDQIRVSIHAPRVGSDALGGAP